MRFLLLLAAFVLLACQEEGPKEKSNPKWDGVSVKVKDAVVVASVEMDSMKYSRWWFEQDALSDSTVQRHEQAHIAITRGELDSLISLAQRLIQEPVLSEDGATEIVGDNVKVRLFHGVGSGKVELAVSYVSVDHWLSLSPLNMKLKAMTFDRFENVPKRSIATHGWNDVVY